MSPEQMKKLPPPTDPDAEDLTVGSHEALKNVLRTAQLRATASRLAVLRYLQQGGAPISHAEVVEGLASTGFDRATLYRNLTDLTKVGLVRRTDLGDHVWRFEMATVADAHAQAHPHFVCTACGDVTCLPDAGINIRSGAVAPRALRSAHVDVQLRGICDSC
jgi:Fur family ferric uptake transcriptional regulator